MKINLRDILISLVILAALVPLAPAKAATFETSAWIPYWRKFQGMADAIAHINQLDQIDFFGYTVKKDGSLYDQMKVNEMPWTLLAATARAHKVRVIASITWADADAINTVMRSPMLRGKHIAQIVEMVNSHAFDGVDIDYEAKYAETRPYFSLFLKELYAAMGKKWVMCTIESRTPLTSRYDHIPAGIEYANDFVEINKYCDRVRIMAYDQGAIDIRLNELEPGPYAPVADIRWVKKVMDLAAQSISKRKLVLGVPTYGYEYEVTPLSEDGYKYNILWSFNPGYANNLATIFSLTPQRGASGERNFLYVPTSTMSTNILPASTTPVGLSNNLTASTTFIDPGTGKSTTPKPTFRLVWWSDAEAIKGKANLAKSLGLRGVAVFKVDGGEDPAMWQVLPK